MLRMSAGAKQDFATCVGKCAAYMWVSEWGAGVARQSGLISDWWQLCNWCNGGWKCVCRSAVNDGSCSPWVMCSCSVVRGNQIRDSRLDSMIIAQVCLWQATIKGHSKICSFITQHNATDVASFEGAWNWHADCRNVHQSCCPWIEC